MNLHNYVHLLYYYYDTDYNQCVKEIDFVCL